jgi:hypothetical protein
MPNPTFNDYDILNMLLGLDYVCILAILGAYNEKIIKCAL